MSIVSLLFDARHRTTMLFIKFLLANSGNHKLPLSLTKLSIYIDNGFCIKISGLILLCCKQF